MFIRLKKPTFVLGMYGPQELPQEVLFNVARIGTVIFDTYPTELVFTQRDGRISGRVGVGQARTIQIDIDGDLSELLHRAVQRRMILVFPPDQHGEYERIKRILEARVVES